MSYETQINIDDKGILPEYFISRSYHIAVVKSSSILKKIICKLNRLLFREQKTIFISFFKQTTKRKSILSNSISTRVSNYHVKTIEVTVFLARFRKYSIENSVLLRKK